MNPTPEQLNAQLQQLTESNETLLRSKSKLQQELLSLKKMLGTKEQQLHIQSEAVSHQNVQWEENERIIRELREANLQQQELLTQLTEQVARLEKENLQLQQRSWFQRLFGKR